MTDFLILGTDTDAGKTTLAALWLAAFPQEFAYWKPVESGDSDTEKIRRLVPQAHCFAPGLHFERPVAPPLAASAEGRAIPAAKELARLKPVTTGGKQLLVETFGGPLSPLNDHELQINLIRQLALPTLLAAPSVLGAISRTLKCLYALKQEGVRPFAVALLGPRDDYAVKQITRYGLVPVFSLSPPLHWEAGALQNAATQQRDTLEKIHTALLEFHNSQTPLGRLDVPAKSNSTTEKAATTAAARDGATEQAHFAALLAQDARDIWHPYTSLREPDPPLLVVSAQDEFLHLADGRTLIDGISSWWTILHGHRRPELMHALAEATNDFDHVHFAGVTHGHAIRLAELLLKTAPWSGGRVFYSDDGSTAVEVALKLAYQFWCHRNEPERSLFIGFEHGYHGDTFGAMAASRDPVFFGRFEPLLFRAEIVPVDPERLDETLRRNKGRVAAVIIEPLVQGAGGMRMHAPETLRALFEIARQHETLFIADEVMTGGGRLGPLWAHQAAGIGPDLICTAKTLTGGVMPLAATLVAPHIVAAFETPDRSKTFFHGHSFTAHPLACAVAVANWELLTASTNDAPSRFEHHWRQTLSPLADLPHVRDIRCRGTIAAIELDSTDGYLAEFARRLRRTCLEHGVLLRPLGNVLYAMPPFCTSPDSLTKISVAMTAAVQSLKG